MKIRLPLLLAAAILSLIPASKAASYTWAGTAGDNNWFTNGNWNLANSPATGDAVTIDNSTANITVDNTGSLQTNPSVANFYLKQGKLTLSNGTINVTASGDQITVGQITGKTATLVIESGGQFIYNAPSGAKKVKCLSALATRQKALSL